MLPIYLFGRAEPTIKDEGKRLQKINGAQKQALKITASQNTLDPIFFLITNSTHKEAHT